MRIIIRVLLVLVLIVILTGVGGCVYLRSSLPKTTGSIKLNGLNGQVEIVRDADGVPHIFAATDHDAYFALGYVHAQDRMWQMDFQRRVGAGRLSEVLGDATLDTDKFLRTLGTYRAAEVAVPALNDDSREALQAYADGVNAWLDEGRVLPIEFLVLGFKPEPWVVADSLVWSKMMAWNLGGNYDIELLRFKLAQALGPERTAELIPPYPEDAATIIAGLTLPPNTADALLEIDTYLQQNLNLRGLDIGSNNWVVGGSRTDSGLPLLANDPHLGAQIPSIWYLAEVQGDKIHVTGATLPGLPIFPTGHNENIAWGVTNLGPDVQDLYIERINPKNLYQYEVEGEWVDMDVVEEAIYIKDEDEPILWAARSTRHGPLISDVSGSAPMAAALRWTALMPDDTTLNAFHGVNYASNWEEFTEAFKSYVAPSQNFVFADKEGNIGYFGPGKIPVRDQGEGLVPVPGWDSEYEWGDWIPFEDLPQSYNPEIDYIATANNKVVPADYPYFISYEWAMGYRAERIVELIEEKSSGGETISVEDMAAIQADQRSAQTQQLLPQLLNIESPDERQAKALTYLRDWDGVSSTDSVATSIYQAWFVHLGSVIFEDDLRGDLYDDMANRYHSVFLNNMLENPENIWCDNFLTTPFENCSDASKEALDRALDDLEERLGKDMSKWEWGKLHLTQYPHKPFSEVAPLKRFFHREIPNGGDKYTVNVAPGSISEPFLQYHVPSYRQIIDMSNLNNSLFMHTTGQSGNVFSTHYDDLIERHQAVEYLPMTFGRDQVNGDSLILSPK